MVPWPFLVAQVCNLRRRPSRLPARPLPPHRNAGLRLRTTGWRLGITLNARGVACCAELSSLRVRQQPRVVPSPILLLSHRTLDGDRWVREDKAGRAKQRGKARRMAMNWLGNKLVSEITPSDLEGLLSQKASEDQWLEFKREPYVPVKRLEMLKDITALANAEGGYLLIGAAEEDSTITSLCSVPDAQRHADDMLKSCLQNIRPRIEGLEIAVVRGPAEEDVIVVRVPSSANRPHMYTLHDRTQFALRYGTHNREMTIGEIRGAFLQDRQLLQLRELNERLDAVVRSAVAQPRAQIQSSDPALEMSSPTDLRSLMDKRFAEWVGDQPYYRIWAMPTELDPQLIDTDSDSIRALVEEPPHTRRDGWVIWPMRDIRPTGDGLLATTGSGTQRLVLLNNGYMEFSHPARNEAFQWKQATSEAADHPWLYSYAVCEFPVNFCRLVSTLLAPLERARRVILRQSYLNIRRFRLRGDKPQDFGFGLLLSEPFPRSDLIVNALERDLPLGEDPAAFDLIKQVYNAFGYSKRDIPFFDAEGRFDADAGPDIAPNQRGRPGQRGVPRTPSKPRPTQWPPAVPHDT